MISDDTLEIKEWHTPASDYPRAEYGFARIADTHYPRGFYTMEGVNGVDYYHLPKGITITELKINGKTWMVDDPLHWKGTEHYLTQLYKATTDHKHLLVVGLGLGLVIHLNVMHQYFDYITIVEENNSVINLMQNNLPPIQMQPYGIECADWYTFDPEKLMQPDISAIYWDLAVGDVENTRPEYMRGLMQYAMFYSAPITFFGFNVHNPIIKTNEVVRYQLKRMMKKKIY